MPKRHYKYFKPKGYRGSRMIRYQPTRRKYNSSVRAQMKRLKKTVYNNLQNNWIDTVQSPIGITAGGTIYPNFCSLLDIEKGDDHDDRIGERISLKNVSIKGQFRCSSTDIFNEMRIIIFSVKNPNTNPNQVVVSDILQNADLYSHYKKNSKVKYRILLDKHFACSNPRAQVGLPAVNLNGCPYKDFIHWETKINLKGMKTTFREGSTQGNNVQTGGLYMLLISDSLAPSNPTFGYQSRLTFAP